MNLTHNFRQHAQLIRQFAFDTNTSSFMTALLLVLFAVVSSGVNTNAQDSAAPVAKQTQSEAPAKRRTPQKARANNAERAATESRGAAAGAITGRVVADDGHPLANISVSFSKRGNLNMPGSVSAATDAEGKFRAENLDPGVYNAGVYVPGYTRVRDAGVERGEPLYYRPGENVTITMTKGGVITGTVRNANGDPIVGAPVRAVFVRQPDGRTPHNPPSFFYGPPRASDDRGVYRIFGLEPGSYVVSVGGGNDQFGGPFSPFAGEMPTYHPSTTRDGAVEVVVQTGQEASGIDIRHRGEHGRAVSGKVSGLPESESDFNYSISISLTHAASGIQESFTYLTGRVGDRSFSLDGVADGEYEVRARRSSRQGETMASAPQRVTVRGADVTGLNLTLAPLASISGRVTLEAMREAERAASSCAGSAPHAASPTESLVVARREEKDADAATQSRTPSPNRLDAAPDAQGEFTIKGLDAGRYRLEALPPGEDWYVRDSNVFGSTASALLPTRKTAAPRTPAAANAATRPGRNPPGTIISARDWLTLASGQRSTGAIIILAEGAASLRGTVAVAEGATLPARLRVYLVPSEPERADDPLRYVSAAVAGDNTFALTNLAPGRYWLLAQPVADSSATETRLRAAAWDAPTRTKLRRDAAATTQVIDFKTCQHVKDFSLPYVEKK
ncbi:MAG: carboxypeptidase-like regulatory domain-containing protein [Acidobacteriota bacterium]|nr:carboxypeptidase-like regulatory domain-containing protein [Acidobacteriota bacterium]